jgi:hypothetical protein
MFNKKSKLYSIINLKCPRCHEGNLFCDKNPYELKTMLNMPVRCLVCQQDFVMEPGFYSGALWASYPIVIGVLVLTWLILNQVLGLSSYVFVTGTLAALVLQPIIMRLGRSAWIHVFVTYRGKLE